LTPTSIGSVIDMVGFRVTKYDPGLRRPDGTYSMDEWTSVSDVGRAYNGKIVSRSEYLRGETNYVQAVRCFIGDSGLQKLRVTDLQLNEVRVESLPSEIAQETLAHVGSAVDEIDVCGDDLDWIVRLALREAIWCRLKGDQGFYVHFGYDYYMYIGSDEMKTVPPLLPSGIFAEVFDSPHQPEPSDEADS